MTDDPSLFDDGDTFPGPSKPLQVPPISDRQVAMLRVALDGRGLESMAERQQAIESAAGRAVDSLRALTQEEAIKVLARLAKPSPPIVPGNSTWDDREKDTWIDRM